MFIAFSNSASTRYSKQLGARVPFFGRQQQAHLQKWLETRSKAEEEVAKAREERYEKEQNGEEVDNIPWPELPLPPPELADFFGQRVFPILILEPEDMSSSLTGEYLTAWDDVDGRPLCALAVGQNFETFAKNSSWVQTVYTLTDKRCPTILS